MAIQEQISLEKNQARVGKVYRCLVDRIEDEYIVARTEYDSPEVDDEVLIPASGVACTPRPGDFVDACITDATEHDLMGRLVTPA